MYTNAISLLTLLTMYKITMMILATFNTCSCIALLIL